MQTSLPPEVPTRLTNHEKPGHIPPGWLYYTWALVSVLALWRPDKCPRRRNLTPCGASWMHIERKLSWTSNALSLAKFSQRQTRTRHTVGRCICTSCNTRQTRGNTSNAASLRAWFCWPPIGSVLRLVRHEQSLPQRASPTPWQIFGSCYSYSSRRRHRFGA